MYLSPPSKQCIIVNIKLHSYRKIIIFKIKSIYTLDSMNMSVGHVTTLHYLKPAFVNYSTAAMHNYNILYYELLFQVNIMCILLSLVSCNSLFKVVLNKVYVSSICFINLTINK